MPLSDLTGAADSPAQRDARPDPLSLTTLGAVRLVRHTDDGDRVVFEGANKALALFTYLACAPGRGATRAHLQELLWERLDPEAAQRSLRTYVWKVRTALWPDVITGGELLVLNTHCDVDRSALLEAATAGDADGVVARYRGEFFPSYAQPDSPEFDAWVQGERVRLRGLFARCAERVVAREVDRGHFREAIAVGRRLRDADPMDESGWRPLLNALLVSGDAVNAANECAVLTRTLAADERAPLPATTSLLTAIARMGRRDDAPSAAVDQFVTPLIGREREFSQLLATWMRVRDGACAQVHVRGLPGMGKSRLLEDFATRLSRERAVAVRTRADIGRRTLPYAFVGAVAAQLAARRGAAAISPGSKSALLAINPALSSFFDAPPDLSTDDEALRRRTLAFGELVTVLADEQPFALLLDDMQWADSASCAVLAGAFARSDTNACLLVTAGRDALGTAFADASQDTITLAGLTVDGVNDLLQSLAMLPDAAWAVALPPHLHRASAGLPFHLFDALRLANERAILTRAQQTWQCTHPDALAELIDAGAALPRRIGLLHDIERDVLLRLAVAGEPCDATLLHSADADFDASDAAALDAALVRLERLGYITLADMRWALAHNEVSDAVLALHAEHDVRNAHATLAGRLLASVATPSAANAGLTLRTVIRHGLLGQQRDVLSDVSSDALGDAFAQILASARASHDRRSLSAVAADALGEMNSPANRTLLARSLTTRHRVLDLARTRWRTAVLTTSAVAAASLLGAFVATRPTPAAVDGYLAFLQADGAGRASVREVPLTSAVWPENTPIDASAGRVVATLTDDPMLGGAVPTGRREGEWIGALITPDSGMTDLFLFAPNHPPTRLTTSRGDDLDPSMAPDGQQVAFASARWKANGSRSIAVLDLRSGAVIRLTDAMGSDETPTWSPDGRRIAFTRRTSDAVQLCVVTVDGRTTRCPVTHAGAAGIRVLAWRDDSVVLADINYGYARVHLDSASVVVLDSVSVTRTVSPDARWVAAERGPAHAGAATTCEVAPALTPWKRRLVQFAVRDSVHCRVVLWSRARADRRYVDKITIRAVRVGPFVGVPHQLMSVVTTATGDTSAATHVLWTTSDSTLATIDSTGVLHSRARGTVTVRASYGGWRADSVRLTITAAPARSALQEDWQRELAEHWIPFGVPTPRIVTLADGAHAFLNNGDGAFQSGVHSRATFPVDSGLALDTWVSVPVTMDRSQVVRVGLYRDIDSVGLARWNHVDGWAFAPGRGATANCEFRYPSGSEGMRSYTDRFGAATLERQAPASWANGERIRVRLQLFPDGRCGAAINGRVVGIAITPTGTSRSRAHVFLYGNSPGTQAVVGAVSVTLGVADGIDWGALDSSQTPRAQRAPIPRR